MGDLPGDGFGYLDQLEPVQHRTVDAGERGRQVGACRHPGQHSHIHTIVEHVSDSKGDDPTTAPPTTDSGLLKPRCRGYTAATTFELADSKLTHAGLGPDW
ncbi:hypothetical protein Psuf_076420 [Phytohabitans suffuscus]|uniref:Uncharacterized protein n=1 Tax=Phytohabitans suffuscus TaxID=624315 RepID=A0A6F8YW71_9ACTN|nr:hypothetical protein Psuf_076420 [Phytohabitans suffuscus]